MDRRRFFKSLAGLVGVALFGRKMVKALAPIEEPTKLLLHHDPYEWAEWKGVSQFTDGKPTAHEVKMLAEATNRTQERMLAHALNNTFSYKG